MNQKDFVQLIHPLSDKLFRLAKRLLISTRGSRRHTQKFSKIMDGAALVGRGAVLVNKEQAMLRHGSDG
jgi:hypothetical protein